MTACEWDDEKRLSNIEKHKIDFILATQVFDDPSRLEWSSENHGELRTITMGSIHGEIIIVICVVWTKRDRKKRIISARRASQRERKQYER